VVDLKILLSTQRGRGVFLKVLITAALPYANGPIHIGHLRSTYLPADVYARYCRLKGMDAVFVCATDEHGAPIEFKALQQGIPPGEFARQWRSRHAEDFASAGIMLDNFYTTDSREDKELCDLFFNTLNSKGYIYRKKIGQMYCEKDKRYLPDRFIRGTCPNCGALDQYGDSCEKCGKTYSPSDMKDARCAICGSKPVKREVEHYFFKLTAFSDFLRKWFAENKATLPSDVLNYLSNWLDGLQDWDVSRDGPYHGFKIVGEADKYYYVWWDAPIGYVASTVNWASKNNASWESFWKSSDSEIVHFIGKDIIYHHFLFWPSMLHGVGFSLPRMMPTRGYLNIEQEKMSKSRGTFILLREFVEKFPPDFLRYYLTAITPNNMSDGNFLWSEFQSKANSELIDAYCNFVLRVLSFIKTKFAGKIPSPGEYSKRDRDFADSTEALFKEVQLLFDKVELKSALERIMAFANECNRYFNEREPWHLVKEKQAEAATVLFLSAKAAYALALASEPILPFTADKIYAQLNAAGARKWGDLSAVKEGAAIGEPKPLYAKIDDSVILAEIAKLQGEKPKEKKIV
jgi:methionyl-tRNA synthetase